MNKQIYKKMMGAAAAVLCSVWMTISVLADDPPRAATYDEGPTSNLWLSVVELQSEARLSVTVPVSYGFAVVGTVDTADDKPVTSADGMILLSNVRVEVTDPSDPDKSNGKYTITTTGNAQVTVNNYSTDVRIGNLGVPNPPREGLPVEIKAYVVETPDTLLEVMTGQHYWKPIEIDPTGQPDLFKRYRMGVDGKYFDTPGTINDGKKDYDAYFQGENLSLPAPPDVLENGWNASGIARVPAVTAFKVDVQVGGTRGQYHQVEQSVMVGKIGWEIIPGELPTMP